MKNLRHNFNMGFVLLVILSVSLPCQVFAMSARQIMEKVDARDDGDRISLDSEMILIDKQGHKRTREIKVFMKDKGEDTLKMQFFVSPADVKDTGFLTYDYYSGEKDDDQWLYLPELHKTKRIASSDKSQAFMGSDFSYADMNRRVLDEWAYRLVKESTVGDQPVWLVEATPVSEVIVKRYGYTKSLLFIRQDNFYPIRAIHWIKEGKKIKYMEVKKLALIDAVWIATETAVKTTKNKKTLHKTLLKWTNIKFNQDIDASLFTVRRLEKGI